MADTDSGMKRFLYALVPSLALIAGLAAGLFYTWELDPMERQDTGPSSLYVDDKIAYLALIGDLYGYDQDLDQARERLAAIGIDPAGPDVVGYIEQYLDDGGSIETVRNLAHLARDLGASGGVLLVFGSEPEPSPTPVAPQSNTPEANTPTVTPVMTAVPRFALIEKAALCADTGQAGQVQVIVQDATGKGLAGVQVLAAWAVGQDQFFTGMRPQKGQGYADFAMSPDVAYDISLADYGGDVAQQLTSAITGRTCPTTTIALNWRLVFQQEP